MFFSKNHVVTQQETTREAHAKINLTLDVTGRRADGYHTVQMVMQSVALHDTVHVRLTHGEKKPRGIVLTCSLPYLPVDESNLAYRAADLFYRETGALLETCEIHIEKRIPIAAGLAGGSSDAAAVLRALAELHEMQLSDEELCAMGLKLGADVPYCLMGGTMLAEGIGEQLTPLAPMPPCFVVLCKPPFAVSTAAVYRQMDSITISRRPDTEGMKRALAEGDLDGICKRLCNAMEQVTARKRRQIGEIKKTLEENGACGVLMSGSGPTVFGLFSDEARAKTAEKMLHRRIQDTFLTEIV